MALNMSLKMITYNSGYVTGLKSYRQLQIVSSVINHVFSFVIPICVIFSFWGEIVMGYVLLKLTGIFPHNVILVVALGSVVVSGLAHWLMPEMADLVVNSIEFVRYWRLRISSKCAKRQLRSCRQLRMEVGQFYYFRQESRSVFFANLVYYTMSLVISV